MKDEVVGAFDQKKGGVDKEPAGVLLLHIVWVDGYRRGQGHQIAQIQVLIVEKGDARLIAQQSLGSVVRLPQSLQPDPGQPGHQQSDTQKGRQQLQPDRNRQTGNRTNQDVRPGCRLVHVVIW
ncbi:hypothetical protein OEZ49_17185 [Ruegeria sp. WL0004]|uniref:Uncharacterized protein n=1 Tax=Ruegeria marisflavi TaxID=2984152 RepID=A0ABT2WUC1_9RHOB|nr:hypothetical protein [Ruegeria sp. WL0004]MCU9839511.1 hypothetical protein [Ruegeria sp. WL0004]